MTPKDTRRGIKMIGVITLVFALLVAPHEGEFWPFSIYPMFSQAGNPWTRAMVLDVTDYPETEIWQSYDLGNYPGRVISVREYGVDQIDFSNFVSKTEHWTPERREAMRTMFGFYNLTGKLWLVTKVRGELHGDDSVKVEVQPWLLLSQYGTELNPNLPESTYFREEP
jgi:hypothetical protein